MKFNEYLMGVVAIFITLRLGLFIDVTADTGVVFTYVMPVFLAPAIMAFWRYQLQRHEKAIKEITTKEQA